MLNNIIIAYSLTRSGKKLNATQIHDFGNRGFNYTINQDGTIEKLYKEHGSKDNEDMPKLHNAPGTSLVFLVLGGMNKEDQVEDTTTWRQWDTVETLIRYNRLFNDELNIYGLDELNEEYMLPISIKKYLTTI
jgi:hypothetical protein